MRFREELLHGSQRFEQHVSVRARVRRNLLVEEALEQICVDVAREHLLVLDVHDRRAHVSTDHLLRMREELGVVRSAMRVRDD